MHRIKPDVAVVGDAKASCERLAEILGKMDIHRPDRSASFMRIKAETQREIESVTPHVQFLAAIRKALPKDGIFVEEACQAGFTSYFGYPVYAPGPISPTAISATSASASRPRSASRPAIPTSRSCRSPATAASARRGTDWVQRSTTCLSMPKDTRQPWSSQSTLAVF